ncbi:MAG: threonine/serine dehydratase [Tissierellia bacterium]|jgi:threonine dehydratase|nr:threonine/serine dehydratase [Tissierellia bacterium]
MTLEQIIDAQKRIAPHIIKTPLVPIERLQSILGFVPWLKLENMQNIGAFKIRGAMNAALLLSQEDIDRGFITASSGNHGRAVAYAAKALGTKALILLPNTVSRAKLEGIQALGAQTRLVEPQKRIEIALDVAQKEGLTFIHPYNDENVICGQGSLGLEIMAQLPGVKRILVPMGGGGLISGIALAVKFSRPEIEIIGLEPAAVPKFSQNIRSETIHSVKEFPSIADALLSNKPGSIPLVVARKYVDRIISVEEGPLKEAYRLLLQEGKIYCEPSSAIGFGAVLQGEFRSSEMEDSVFLISGGNILPEMISAIIE